jgi:pimeloyl-ACP methyl ester carboxylesterase
VFCWDDRGDGESEGDYFAANSQQLVDDALAALEHLTSTRGFGRVTLLGHSQGAQTASRLAARNPDRIDSFVWLTGMTLPDRRTLLDPHTCAAGRALARGGRSGVSDAEAARLR